MVDKNNEAIVKISISNAFDKSFLNNFIIQKLFVMTYFKKLTFNQSNAKLTFYKVKIDKGQIIDDGEMQLDLKSNNGSMQLLEIVKTMTAAGPVYSYTVTADSEQPGLYLFKTGFGYLDTNDPSETNFFPINFGKFLDTGTISMDEIVSPPGLPLKSISGQMGKFGCFIGEEDVDQLPPMPPMIVVMEDIKFYIGLEEGITDDTKTYYDIRIQRDSIS